MANYYGEHKYTNLHIDGSADVDPFAATNLLRRAQPAILVLTSRRRRRILSIPIHPTILLLLQLTTLHQNARGACARLLALWIGFFPFTI